MVKRRIIVVSILMLSGCTAVGPNYHVPEHAMVNSPGAQGAFISGSRVAKAAPLPDRWWQLYDDPLLDHLIDRALAANTDLRIADANLKRSLALLDARGASREVQGSLDAATSYAQRSAEAELQHVQPPARPIYNAGISVSYDLDLFGGLKRGIEAASADTEAAMAARDLIRVNVAAETARAYADICNSGYELDVLQQAISLQEKRLHLTQIMIEHGRAAPFELDRTRGPLDASRARLPRLAARQRNALFRITALEGRTPDEADVTLLACHRPLALSQPMPVGDGEALLKRRPDIRMAERKLAASSARIGVETAALYPDIRFGSSAGSTGAVSDLLSPLTNRFGLGPLISWTLNRHAAHARITAANAQESADLAQFDGAVLNALKEVETSLNSYAAGLVQQESLDYARDAAERVASRMAQLRRGGKVSEFEALQAQEDLLKAERAAAENRRAINDDQITLFLALGGGWSENEKDHSSAR